MPRLSSAAQHKGKGSGKATPPASPPTKKRGLSKAAKRAATIAAKKAEDREAEAQDDDDEEDKVSSDMDSDRDDGTNGSSSARSDISEDTKAELVKLIAHRRAAKKRKFSQNSTSAVVTAAAARVSIHKAARTKTRVDSSAKKAKRKAVDDVLPAIPARTMRVRASVNKFISWLSKSTFTLLPAPLPAFNRAESHLALVYTAALLTFSGRVPQGSKVRHDYEAYLSLLDVVQRYLPQLFSETPEALPLANLHVFDTMLGFKAQLDEAFRMLEGQQGLIDLTFSAFTTRLCADGDAFDPLAAIIKLMSSLSNSVLAKQTKIEMKDSFSGARGRSPAFQEQYHQQHQQGYQHHQQGYQQQQQHVGGQQDPEWSEEFGMLCREPELFDGRTLEWACVKCGAGAYWGAKGHNAADCPASDAEIEAWVHHGQAAP
jgi:hypothetical protein